MECVLVNHASQAEVSMHTGSPSPLLVLPFSHLWEPQTNTILQAVCYYHLLQLLLTTLPSFADAWRYFNRGCGKLAQAMIGSHSGNNKMKEKGQNWSGLFGELRKGRQKFDNGPKNEHWSKELWSPSEIRMLFRDRSCKRWNDTIRITNSVQWDTLAAKKRSSVADRHCLSQLR